MCLVVKTVYTSSACDLIIIIIIIFTVCIPSHTSPVFNIGDRTVFGNMKKYLRESCLNFLRNKTGIIKIQDFPFIFKEVWNKSVNQQGIMKGKRFNIIIHDFSF